MAMKEKCRLLWKYIMQGMGRDGKKEIIFEKNNFAPWVGKVGEGSVSGLGGVWMPWEGCKVGMF